ncbi:MAG TPA: 2-polyprenyl-3-methyl-6-methoxy-1,4-benzoquinone monooxygenase [Xanthomonadaceae bacterium]|nr:2-polyprenyl-3-methyl-6-methoxy-1,4-benzoquinone monooxygenase [Xanthomonadaceae bacterium]
MTRPRHLSPLDRILAQLDHALRSSLSDSARTQRPNPAEAIAAPDSLDPTERRHAAGLMRVNHAGEVCAQALYFGQAAVAGDPATRERLLEAAGEEGDHLAWCGARLTELGSRPSVLNPLWYAGSYAIGALAGLAGDGYNLGFVVETERQVEAHLGDHLERLPPGDARSRAIVRQMQSDEVEHGRRAQAAGAHELPAPVPALMRVVSGVMKVLAYRV